MFITLAQPSDHSSWNRFVQSHPNGSAYHLCQWQEIIESVYGHRTYYLLAKETSIQEEAPNSPHIIGILPLVHMKSPLFGNTLVSMPFMDHGGLLAQNKQAEEALIAEALNIGQRLKVKTIELRQAELTPALEQPSNSTNRSASPSLKILRHKSRMLLSLPSSPDTLMKSFKSKLRSQIKRPLKEGLYVRTGGRELLDDFYAVFLTNMRDLGSPVHSRRLMAAVLDAFQEKARLFVVYRDHQPLAASMTLGFKTELKNPWASSLKQYSRLSPNMLLYWNMLEYACSHGYTTFDFGRSTPAEGTYKFKTQWGAQPALLHWHVLSFNGTSIPAQDIQNSKYTLATKCWQKLPVPVTSFLGPIIRKHISL